MELAPRFGAYATRIENGRVNEPLTILETNQFPTLYFCAATRGWPGEGGDLDLAELFEDCNAQGYRSDQGGCEYIDEDADNVCLYKSSYRYLEVRISTLPLIPIDGSVRGLHDFLM